MMMTTTLMWMKQVVNQGKQPAGNSLRQKCFPKIEFILLYFLVLFCPRFNLAGSVYVYVMSRRAHAGDEPQSPL